MGRVNGTHYVIFHVACYLTLRQYYCTIVHIVLQFFVLRQKTVKQYVQQFLKLCLKMTHKSRNMQPK